MATEKTIQLKDKQGNKLFPKVNAESIPAGAVGEAKLDDGVKNRLVNKFTVEVHRNHSGEYYTETTFDEVCDMLAEGKDVEYRFADGNDYEAPTEFRHACLAIDGNSVIALEPYLPPQESTPQLCVLMHRTDKSFTLFSSPYLGDGGIQGKDLADNAVTKDKLSQDLQAKLDGVATTEGLAALQQTVDTLNGDAAKAGSVKKQIADAIAGVTQFDVQVVTALPAASAAKKGVLYLIKDTHTDAAATGATDTYDEYIFLPGTTEGTGTFEKIGNTDLDISGKADTSKLTDGSIKVKSATEADNAAKVGGHTVAKDVPADAKLTDTVYDDTALAGRVSTLEGAALCYYEEVTE